MMKWRKEQASWRVENEGTEFSNTGNRRTGLVGIAAVGIGIGVELTTGAEIGWAVITIGSCLVATGGLIWGKFMRGGK